MFRPHTVILSCYRILSSRSCCSVMPIFAYVMLPAMCWTCASPDVVLIILLYNLQMDTDNKHNIRWSTCPAHGWQHNIGEHWHNRATTSEGEYSVTTEDGSVRPKHVLIEFKKWMCYIDGQKNKYLKYVNLISMISPQSRLSKGLNTIITT
jgi:hypothetical protein